MTYSSQVLLCVLCMHLLFTSIESKCYSTMITYWMRDCLHYAISTVYIEAFGKCIGAMWLHTLAFNKHPIYPLFLKFLLSWNAIMLLLSFKSKEITEVHSVHYKYPAETLEDTTRLDKIIFCSRQIWLDSNMTSTWNQPKLKSVLLFL